VSCSPASGSIHHYSVIQYQSLKKQPYRFCCETAAFQVAIMMVRGISYLETFRKKGGDEEVLAYMYSIFNNGICIDYLDMKHL
jgi:hypothetical protein